MVVEDNVVLSMKTNKIILNAANEIETYRFIKTKNNTDSIVFYYLSNIFKLSKLCDDSVSTIERCFPMIVEYNNFLELDFLSIRKILSNNGLNIDSELQVFNAVVSWLCYDITERRKYAIGLLPKVRLSLLSIPALKQILDKVLSYSIGSECVNIIESVLLKKNQLKLNYFVQKTRYCNQTNFEILVCGGKNASYEVNKNVRSFNANNFCEAHYLSQAKMRRIFKAVSIKGKVYVFGGDTESGFWSVEKYSPDTNTWEHVTDMMDNRKGFVACSFMHNVYVVGGSLGSSLANTCFEFDTKCREWKKLSSMSVAKVSTACSVFEGKVVVGVVS